MSGCRFWITATVLGLAGFSGPEHRSNLFSSNPPCNSCGQNGFAPDQRLTPFPAGPTGPPPAGFMPPASGPTQLPLNSPAESRRLGGPVGRADPAFQPAIDANVRLDGPQKYTPEPAFAQIRLDVPVPVRIDAKAPASTLKPPAEPETVVRAEVRDKQEPAPVDIPGYVVVSAGVSTGQQPFPDGIAWLSSKGYRTVLHLCVWRR